VLQTLAGERLRVAAGSDFKFIGTERIQLLSGQVYVESSDSDTGNQRLEIRTQFGSVTHLGTRYAVALSTDRMAIRVREGLVGVTTGALRTDAGAGVEVEIDRKGREINRQRISTYGSMWAWAESLAPPLQIDGRRLADVLREIAAETGRRLEFANEAVRRACAEIELKGPFLDLPAADRLFAVLVTTGLEATESGDRILIQEQMEDTSARPVSD
jgi:ferric-dicitrate binding protein FerR (iron transport regulator)